ncbi:DNA (cytosine-5)-methyltransferase 1 [Fontibacillus solani]|uniref:Cytosine-specific methyltransferase n=1 Tax=Fontibacillus solani TaxID=1572857 RepID=A0A7W3SRM5_9BACL|nr:DNA cytosine methyltransferase [Fontibacillus solani]MBA9084941.1 DNA (cytosine-5)-methyltransferase 1 [Fontibacillus solani]
MSQSFFHSSIAIHSKKYNVLDLFSGAGGMSEGFLQAGFKITNACDYSSEAAETYQNRHRQLGYKDSVFFNGDIKKLTTPKKMNDFLNGKKIDVIVGGPPCQGFSISGKRNKDDPRNVLFLEYLKVVKLVKPKYFVIENVEGILTFKIDKITGISGTIYENDIVPNIIVNEAKKLGYHVEYRLLNAKNYSVPQNRPRVIFLGHMIKNVKGKIIHLVAPPVFPTPQENIISVEDAISDLRFLTAGKKTSNYDNRYKPTHYQLALRNGLTPNINGNSVPATSLSNHWSSRHTENVVDRFKMLEHGESIGDLLKRLSSDEYKKYKTKKYRCTKLHPKSVSPTVLTLPDDIVHYDLKNPRILSVRELARLQSFDDSFEFLGKRTTGGNRRRLETPQYTQVGNAVPPLFAKAIARQIMKALKDSEQNFR